MEKRSSILKYASILLILGALSVIGYSSFLTASAVCGGTEWLRVLRYSRKSTAFMVIAIAQIMTLPEFFAGIWGLLPLRRQRSSYAGRISCLLADVSSILYMLLLNHPLLIPWAFFQIFILAVYWAVVPSVRVSAESGDDIMKPLQKRDFAKFLCFLLFSIIVYWKGQRIIYEIIFFLLFSIG